MSGDTGGVVFSNSVFPVTISLNVPKSFISKYQIGAGFPSQAPEDWSVTLCDEEDFDIGADVRSGETFFTGQFRELPYSPAASVSKAVVFITRVPLSIARDSIATRVNEQGFIEVVMRFLCVLIRSLRFLCCYCCCR